MSSISVVTKYVSELTQADKENFYDIFSQVYGDTKDIQAIFAKKYEKNIYGDSLLVFALDGDKCVGIQAFLRDDLDGEEAYQSGDSATLASHRGKGIFSSMVKEGINKLPKNAIIYGFPNNCSLPAFVKMGWKTGERKKYSIFSKKYLIEQDYIKEDYFKWMIESPCGLFYCKRGRNYYILKRKKYNIYIVIGVVTKEMLSQNSIKQVKLPILLVYEDKGKIGNGMIPIFYERAKEVPVHKMDTVLTE